MKIFLITLSHTAFLFLILKLSGGASSPELAFFAGFMGIFPVFIREWISGIILAIGLILIDRNELIRDTLNFDHEFLIFEKEV